MLVKLRLAQSDRVRPERFDPLSAALAMLWQAYRFAASIRANRWQHAVELEELHLAGVSRIELRWLLANGLILHAREIVDPQSPCRRFVTLPRHSVPADSCFVLSDAGIAACHEAAPLTSCAHPGQHHPSMLEPHGLRALTQQHAQRRGLPCWNGASRELRVGTVVVKRFRSPAVNQEAILTAFEEEAWPPRIDDPLPPVGEQDPRRRLSDAIKFLNRRQVNQLLRFRGDGTGKGVLWELRD